MASNGNLRDARNEEHRVRTERYQNVIQIDHLECGLPRWSMERDDRAKSGIVDTEHNSQRMHQYSPAQLNKQNSQYVISIIMISCLNTKGAMMLVLRHARFA